MITISVPFRIDSSGRLAETSSLQEAAEHQILDVLMTAKNERVMRPGYGSGVRELLFDVLDPGNLSYTGERAREALSQHLTEAAVQDCYMVPSATSGSTAEIVVTYSLVPYDRTFTLRASLAGVLTEESPI